MKTVKLITLLGIASLSGCASMTSEEINALSRQLAQPINTYNYQNPYTYQNPYVEPVRPIKQNNNNQNPYVTPVYDASQCIGTVLYGKCIGNIAPTTGVQKKCHGTVVNGECHGAIGY